MSKQPFQIDDVGSQIKETVEDSDQFEHALITTYTVTPGYLNWFEGLDTLVCAPSDAADDIYLSADINTDQLSVLERDVHGKCVVVWNANRIIAWVGSFNLSHAGLFTNVEWAARFEGAVTGQFTTADIHDGSLGTAPTNNERITQLLETVQALTQGTAAESIDDALRRWATEPIVVHSGRGNSLRRSVERSLREISGDVTLSYYTPNVNKTGVKELASLTPADIDDEHLTIEVYSAQPSAVIDKTRPTIGSFVGTSEVQELEDQFGEFRLRTRLPGDDGETLSSGSQIRGGLAHLKALVISESDGDGEVVRNVLLTSANLTANAWSATGENVEYGIWLRDPERIETAGTFFLESLADCYGRADEQTLRDIDERMEAGSGGFLPYTRRSIGDLVTTQLRHTRTNVDFEWPDDEVPCDVEGGRWFLRDIVTGAVEVRDATFASTERLTVPDADNVENQFVEALELQATTPLDPPVYELSASQLTQLATGTLDEPIEDWDRLLIDGSAYSTDGAIPVDVLDAAETGYLYRTHDRSITRTVRIDAEHLETAGFDDPLLPDNVIVDVAAATQTVDGLGRLPCLDVSFASGVSPPTDSLDFEMETGPVTPVGWMNISGGRRYAFEPSTSSRSITVSLGNPLETHYPSESHSSTLPQTATDEQTPTKVSRGLRTIQDIRPKYCLAGLSVPNIPDVDTDVDPFIHEDSSLSISLDDTALADIDSHRHAYEASREGYFYSPPTKRDCTDTFTPPAPYSRVTIQGLLGVEVANETAPLWLYTDAVTIDVRKRLIDSLQPSPAVPKALPFASLDAEQAILWLGFDFEDLSVENVGYDALNELDFECWRDETKLTQSDPIRALKEPPDYYAIPLFRPALEASTTYQVVVRPSETGTKYAWSANEYSVSLTHRSEDTFRLAIEGYTTFEIRDDESASHPMIELDRLLKTGLGEELRYHSCFDNDDDDWHPESIQQTSEVVLQFVERD